MLALDSRIEIGIRYHKCRCLAGARLWNWNLSSMPNRHSHACARRPRYGAIPLGIARHLHLLVSFISSSSRSRSPPPVGAVGVAGHPPSPSAGGPRWRRTPSPSSWPAPLLLLFLCPVEAGGAPVSSDPEATGAGELRSGGERHGELRPGGNRCG
jgi:hypothetical protein